MNVFDSEAYLADQETAERCFLYAQAGLTLEEVRALDRFQGRVN